MYSRARIENARPRRPCATPEPRVSTVGYARDTGRVGVHLSPSATLWISKTRVDLDDAVASENLTTPYGRELTKNSPEQYPQATIEDVPECPDNTLH